MSESFTFGRSIFRSRSHRVCNTPERFGARLIRREHISEYDYNVLAVLFIDP